MLDYRGDDAKGVAEYEVYPVCNNGTGTDLSKREQEINRTDICSDVMVSKS